MHPRVSQIIYTIYTDTFLLEEIDATHYKTKTRQSTTCDTTTSGEKLHPKIEVGNPRSPTKPKEKSTSDIRLRLLLAFSILHVFFYLFSFLGFLIGFLFAFLVDLDFFLFWGAISWRFANILAGSWKGTIWSWRYLSPIPFMIGRGVNLRVPSCWWLKSGEHQLR